MGQLLYISGELEEMDCAFISDRQKREIEDIRNGLGRCAFAFNKQGELTFQKDMIEGADPFNDSILKPIEKLIDYAEKNDLSFSGAFDVEGNDFSDATIYIDNNKMDIFEKRIDFKEK